MQTTKVSTRYGDMIVPLNDQFIARSLIKYGEWTQNELGLLEQVIQPGAVVIDGGANIGYHTLAFAKAVGPQGRVLAFEPLPLMFRILAANIVNNSFGNVLPLNAVLSDAAGWTDMPDFTYVEEFNWGATQVDAWIKRDKEAIAQIPIPVHRLDDLAFLGRVDVIKLDVEEMETFVLNGARRLIAKNRPVLFVENEKAGPKSQELIELLFELEYEPYWQIAPYFRSDNFRGDQENIFGKNCCINILALPRERGVKVHKMTRIASAAEHPRAGNVVFQE